MSRDVGEFVPEMVCDSGTKRVQYPRLGRESPRPVALLFVVRPHWLLKTRDSVSL